MKWMGVREEVVGPSQKGGIIEISGVGIGSITPGISLATINHPNSIKALNSSISNTGSNSHSNFVPFIVSKALIIAVTTRIFSTTAIIT